MAYILIRLVHILCGALWFGLAVFSTFYLLPAVGEAGPDGMKVMGGLQRRGYLALIPILAFTTVLSGIWLFWHFTSGFQPELSRTHQGMAYSLGGALAVLAIVFGLTVVRPAGNRIMAAAQRLAEAPGAERAALAATVADLRRRMTVVGGIVTLLVFTTITLMILASQI